MAADLIQLNESVVACRRCPRLVEWRERVAQEKRAAFQQECYWGKPVPSFGDPDGRILVLGLAPAAHGANRTGRMFTGDRSGDWLYGALHRVGMASQAEATSRDDGLTLRDVWISAMVRCAPPANKPTPAERRRCRGWLEQELDLMRDLRVVVALGGLAFAQILRVLADRGAPVPVPRPRFGHAVQVNLAGYPTLLASYHPSQQNTFTGKLTEAMFDRVWARARALAETKPTEQDRKP